MRKHHVFRSLSGLVVLFVLALAAPAMTYADCTNIPQLQQKAQAGDVEAQKELSSCYWSGRGVAKDERLAMEWLRKAAEQGDAGSQTALGVSYELGIGGLPKSREKAVEWFRKAAVQGNETAQESLRELGENW